MNGLPDYQGAAMITGGAWGLGEASARRLHHEGMAVPIADLNEARGRALTDELGENAALRQVDVTDADSVMEGARAAAALSDYGARRGSPTLSPRSFTTG